MLRGKVWAPQIRRFESQYHLAPQIVGEEMRKAYTESARVVQSAIKVRAPETFKSQIQIKYSGDPVSNNFRAVVFMDTSIDPHAIYQEYGTGTRREPNPRTAYDIYPRFASVLRFTYRGVVRYAKFIRQHPGIRGKHFFRDGFRDAYPQVKRIMAAHLGNITRRLKANASG